MRLEYLCAKELHKVTACQYLQLHFCLLCFLSLDTKQISINYLQLIDGTMLVQLFLHVPNPLCSGHVLKVPSPLIF